MIACHWLFRVFRNQYINVRQEKRDNFESFEDYNK